MMLARAGQLIRMRRLFGKRPCPTPIITAWNGGAVTATGTGFLATRGTGHLDEFIVGWLQWGGGYLLWNDTTVTLDWPLDGATTKVRIVNDCGNTSNEWEI